MLPLVYVYKETGLDSGYNPKYAHINFMNYLSDHEDALHMIHDNIRDNALRLYNLNKLQDNEIYFLDKTPRYYHIVDELIEIFPESKYIFLIRNPVSVFASILDYNFNGDINSLFMPDRQDDLLLAPKVISDKKSLPSENPNFHFINYEDLVDFTAESLNKLFVFLGLDYQIIGKVEYSVTEEFKTTEAIDKKSLLQHKTVVSDYLEAWQTIIDDNQKKSLLLEYLHYLGSEIYEKLGYDFKDNIDKIKRHNVSFRFAIKWDLLNKYRDSLSIRELMYCRIMSRLNHMFYSPVKNRQN